MLELLAIITSKQQDSVVYIQISRKSSMLLCGNLNPSLTVFMFSDHQQSQHSNTYQQQLTQRSHVPSAPSVHPPQQNSSD